MPTSRKLMNDEWWWLIRWCAEWSHLWNGKKKENTWRWGKHRYSASSMLQATVRYLLLWSRQDRNNAFHGDDIVWWLWYVCAKSCYNSVLPFSGGHAWRCHIFHHSLTNVCEVYPTCVLSYFFPGITGGSEVSQRHGQFLRKKSSTYLRGFENALL